MLTTCTACSTQFRVTTSQLRAVHGLVRCSRCHSVFDAFETLREEFEVGYATSPQPPADQNEVTQEPENIPEQQDTPEITRGNEPSLVDPVDPDLQLRATQPTAPTDDLFADLWGESQAPAENSAVKDKDQSPQETEQEIPVLIEDHIPKPPALARDQALYKHVELQPRDKHISKKLLRPWHLNPWWIGTAFMALLLIVQIINAHRVTLSQGSLLGKPLAKIYSALGSPITPPASPDVWQVSNINVTSDPDTPGALSITGTLANGAGFPMHWPILRIELMDRYGEPLRARDFLASTYLSPSQAASASGPGTGTRFRIDVVDPGPDAVGFQVQPCVDVDGNRTCSSTSSS